MFSIGNKGYIKVKTSVIVCAMHYFPLELMVSILASSLVRLKFDELLFRKSHSETNCAVKINKFYALVHLNNNLTEQIYFSEVGKGGEFFFLRFRVRNKDVLSLLLSLLSVGSFIMLYACFIHIRSQKAESAITKSAIHKGHFKSYLGSTRAY